MPPRNKSSDRVQVTPTEFTFESLIVEGHKKQLGPDSVLPIRYYIPNIRYVIKCA